MITVPFLIALSFAAFTAKAQTTTVCVAGQCLAGNSNISIGSTLSSSAGSFVLLPGTYSSDSSISAQLSTAFKSSTAKLTSPDGWSPASTSTAPQLPLTIAPLPGLLSYTTAPFTGRSTYIPLTNSSTSGANSTTLPSGSLFLSPNTWASLLTSTSSRLVLWDTAPYLSQLPAGTTTSQLTLIDYQSGSCTPTCASGGRCTPAGTCACSPGFTGASCESCAPGFFGPKCTSCPTGCTTCDEGLSGSGVCLSSPSASSAPSTCNCENGTCQKGSCTCNPGWTTPTSGTNATTACSTCAAGFFKTPAGECQLCSLGCSSCADSTGICTTCATGFTPDANDRTKCVATPSITSTGTICPDGSFGTSGSATCSVCSPLCETCRGPASTDCIVCGPGRYALGGVCASVDGSGVCSGSTTVGNNAKNSCDSCPSKCTACGIDGFSVASTFDQVKCTKCLPGFVLSAGTCVDKCPAGTFIGSDGVTCTACDSSCGTCAGSAKFCLTCAGAGQLASGGTCVSSCPANTFTSTGACTPCHPDCATCSGSGFNQCTTCSSSRPVPSSGRCLPTCSKTEFFDAASSSCKSCDASCSSCSAAGPTGCLACANPATQVLRAGTCVTASCGSSSSVVLSNLGVCLSELVAAPDAPVPSFTVTPSAPQPTSSASPVVVVSGPRPLEWWQILLIVIGALAIVALLVICWRRRARKARAKQTEEFKSKIERKGLFRRTMRAIFGPRKSKADVEPDVERDSYHHSERGMSAMSNSRRPSIDARTAPSFNNQYPYEPQMPRYRSNSRSGDDASSILSSQTYSREQYDLKLATQSQQPYEPSIYSHITGNTRRVPEPKLPVRDNTTSRFSVTTASSSLYPPSTREASRLRRERERERASKKDRAPPMPRAPAPASPPPLLQFGNDGFDFTAPAANQHTSPSPRSTRSLAVPHLPGGFSRASEAEAYKMSALGAPDGATGTLAHQGQTYWLVPQPTSAPSSSASSVRSNGSGDMNPFRTRRV